MQQKKSREREREPRLCTIYYQVEKRLLVIHKLRNTISFSLSAQIAILFSTINLAQRYNYWIVNVWFISENIELLFLHRLCRNFIKDIENMIDRALLVVLNLALLIFIEYCTIYTKFACFNNRRTILQLCNLAPYD